MAYCTKCGAQLVEGQAFCTQCGTSTGARPSVTTVQHSVVTAQPKNVRGWKIAFWVMCGLNFASVVFSLFVLSGNLLGKGDLVEDFGRLLSDLEWNFYWGMIVVSCLFLVAAGIAFWIRKIDFNTFAISVVVASAVGYIPDLTMGGFDPLGLLLELVFVALYLLSAFFIQQARQMQA